MSGHPGHKEPTPEFFAPLNQPSPNAPQASPLPGSSPTSPPPTIAQTQAVVTPSASSGPTAWYKALFQKAATNRAFALFLAMNVLSLGMGGYILVAPSQETTSTNANAYLPANTPTPFPVTEPTVDPSPIVTAEPTEEPEIIVEPTPEPTEIPIPTPTIDPTQNWNTYDNALYGYTIKYPLNWTALNLGTLEPKIPSYVVFNENTATTSARSITLSVSTRAYQEQLTINGVTGYPYTVAGIKGTWQDMRDSDGNTSIAITLPRSDNIIILRAKTAFASTLYQMLPTLYVTD